MSCPIVIDDHQLNTADLAVHGLRFSPNRVMESASRDWTKVVSNTGYIIGHFVTHAPSFRYGDTIGLHLGQIDQLTFVSTERKELIGTFIDCRAGSATLGRRVVLRFATSLARKLIIPAGIAHTFENMGRVVTRNDLRLFCSPSNDQWRFEDDLLSMPLDIASDKVAPVEVNTLPLPRSAALLFYRLQSDLMIGGRQGIERRVDTSAARQGVEVGEEASAELSCRPLSVPSGAIGVRFEPNSMFPVAPDSWGLVPSTPSCVMDMWVVQGSGPTAGYTVHTQYDVLHTFLDRVGDEVCLEVIDLRRASHTFGTTAAFSFYCDERFHVRIPAGVAYRYRAVGSFSLRSESELFIRGDEIELPSLESDSQVIYLGGPLPSIHPPTCKAPPDALHGLAEFSGLT